MSKNPHAAALGAKGGKAGVGAAKRRSPAHYRKMVRARRTISPAQASTNEDICRLETDNYGSDGAFIQLQSAGVILCSSDGSLTCITHDAFLKMIHWFLEPQRARDAGEVKS